MKIDGLESDIVRKSRAYGIEVIADYIEANGEIGPDERKYIVEILRDKFPKKTGPKRQKDREKIEAEIVFEIIRTMYFWDITAYAARKKIVNFYPNLNEETMKSWWMKYQKSRPERKKTILPNGSKKIVMILKQSKIDDALSALLIGFNPYLADPSTRGILSKTQYPDGYLSIGLKPLS